MGPVDVVIVGSGPAGLGVAGELKRRGLEAVVLERAEAIAARWRSRYAGLRLNTFRAYSHLPGSPLPREAGRYASLETFVAYLEDYARSRSLDVRPGVVAQRVERDRAGGWRVISSGGELSCRNVVVAAGWGAEPNLPGWVNNAAFATRLLHTSQLSDPAEFTGERVLVVGAGNSGIDLAGLLVRAGAQVIVSMRTPPNVFPRDWLGLPLGPTVLLAEHLPARSVYLVGRFIQWQVVRGPVPVQASKSAGWLHDPVSPRRDKPRGRRRLHQRTQVGPRARGRGGLPAKELCSSAEARFTLTR